MAQGAGPESAANASIEAISKPPPGVVLPPREIRGIIEKTAGFVARNGPAFEDRVRQNNTGNPKFSFLTPNDAYNGFYAWRIKEIKEGRGTAVSAGREGEQPAAAPEKPKGPPEPPSFHFSARMPNISAQDLDIVRLTALYVAKHGRSWMTDLSRRESANFQFDFLRPQHTLHTYFQRLIEQYSDLLNGGIIDGGKPEKQRIMELEKDIKDRFRVLERAKQRAEWAKYQEQQKQKKEEDFKKEQLEYHQIDWGDFVLVETVLFNEADEQAELPAPTSLSDLQSASLEQRAMMSLQPHNMRIEEAIPTDEDPAYAIPAPPVQTPHPYVPSPQPTPPQVMGYGARPPVPDEDEEAIRERAEARERAQQAQAAAKAGPGPMRIRNDYVPRAQAKRKNQQMATCPNCNLLIPVDEMEEHIRIELLDDRWKEQRAKAEARNATTNLSTADVANNLKRLASQRSDVFDGVTGQPISEEEQARRKKAALNYDGAPESKDAAKLQQMQNVNVEEQVRRIREKYGQ
ncbi:Surp module [Viridothelium virens]|uniref:Surp module n=1 Tax=Viridothelium virens TaxID=1048519 RepID=A0A6A6HCW5_VIRVR|nr:Surp module [Viridothelium virens]